MGEFLEQNAQMAVYVAGGAVAIGALGATCVAVGSALALGAVAVSGFAAAITAVGGLVASIAGVIGSILYALATPLGVVAIAAVVVANEFGAWSALFEAIKAASITMFDSIASRLSAAVIGFGLAGTTIQQAWESVVAAVASGNMEGAVAIATAGISLAWEQMIGGLLLSWNGMTGGIRDSWTDAITYLAQLGISGFFGIQRVWANMVAFMQQTFDTVGTYVIGTLDFMGTKFQQLASLWASIWSGEKGPEAYAKTGEMQRQFEQRAAERAQGNAATNAGYGRQRDAAILAGEDQAATIFQELAQMGEQEKAARRAGNSAEIEAAKERLRVAREAFAATQTEAAKVNQEREKGGAVKNAAGAAAGASGGVAGAFNASLAAQQVGANAVRERTAKATERTAKGVEKLVEAAGDSGLRAG
jgi:hypothetical protein